MNINLRLRDNMEKMKIEKLDWYNKEKEWKWVLSCKKKNV